MFQQVIRRLLRLRGGDEHRPLVALQHLQPRRDVTRVLQPAIEPAMRRQEGGAQLGDQLLHGVGRFPEAPSELAPEPGGCTRPVTQLMQRRAVVRRRIGEGLPCRQVDQVIGWRVERLEALMANLRPRAVHDLLCAGAGIPVGIKAAGNS